LQADPEMHGFLQSYERDLSGLFIVSQVELKKVASLPRDPGFVVDVVKADGKKCVRCWNYRPAVGESAVHPELCDRCLDAIA
jgi:isoleucyl-tRNA synthetase